LNSVHGFYPQFLGSLFVNDNNLDALFDIVVQNISQPMFFTGVTNIFKTSCEHQFYSFEIQIFHKQRPTLTLMLPNLQQDCTLKCLHKIIYHIWKNNFFFLVFPLYYWWCYMFMWSFHSCYKDNVGAATQALKRSLSWKVFFPTF
jgi:RNAse (barnase) inhibitor barstar